MNIEPIRILLVEDNAGDARLLREALVDQLSAPFELTHVERLAEGLSLLSARSFDVILLDLSLPDCQGFKTFSQIHLQARGVPIVVLSGMDDEALAIKAVQEGAQDYLVKSQVGGAGLVRGIRHAIERNKRQVEQGKGPRKLGKVIGIIGAKGGVGATTVALNVAAALAQAKKDVIAVELRHYPGTFSIQMSRRPFEDLGNLLALAPEAINAAELSKCLTDSSHGFRVLFSPQKMDILQEATPEQVEALITELAAMAEYVILDLPCHPSRANQAAVRRCNFVALVVDGQTSCAALGGLAVELFSSWGISKARVGAVVVHRGLHQSRVKLPEVRAQLGCQIIGIVLPAAEACALSENLGIPLVLSQPRDLASVSLTKLAGQFATGEMNPVAAD